MARPKAGRVIASIEARMGASRLPGKMLADLAGKPAITRLYERLRRCAEVDDVILATTANPADDALAEWAARHGVAVHRGSEDDVLLRVVEAQRAMDGDIVLEMFGDMPLIDPELVDWGIRTFRANACDVLTTTTVPSFPVGQDVVLFRLADLEWVARNIDDPAVREHVSLYFFEHPERYAIQHLVAPPRLHRPDCRLVLDYPEDLELIRRVYERLGHLDQGCFGLEAVLDLLRREPELAAVNSGCEEKAPR
ncbi:MAG: glycosyltransferase family protein [Desulfovibrionaceae bacterium]|jgi:spore coat polysaccharide biosynthesis protein SpsF|nr:glycosyltransferase family protein [Desulfovibrionaceae bacterium]